MSALAPLEIGDFSTFFRVVHGHGPFPWQERLARQVAAEGWPSLLDLPTGVGKTAAIDVAVFALALDAESKARAAPLRIVYVVDRRTIVDQAHVRATRIQAALSESHDPVVRSVRERLAGYGSEGVPLRAALLRGGIAGDDMWARTPDQPLIAVSTVDQVGSRLLFRGYGVTDSMRPIHAGLLGCDVLYLLDEVHLSQPFRETLAAIAARYRHWAERPIPGRFAVVEMSATPGDSSERAFRLDDADRQHPKLLARLASTKPVALVSTTAKRFAGDIEAKTLSLLDRQGATVAVVVNRVKSARELHERLRQVVPDGRSVVHLLTGRMRPFDREDVERRVLGRIRAGRTRHSSDEAIVIVATQSIEAGADFDFDGLITECASLDALRQRFGRLDRLGELAGSARGVLVARADTLKDDPVYGDAIGLTWEWLRTRANGGIVDFGVDALSVPQDAEQRGLLTPKANAPVLLPAHLDCWVQTAPRPEPEPEVALWLHGPQRGLADVQIIWRADLSEALLRAALADTAAQEVALNIVEALPPVTAEALSVPFLAAKRWLRGLPESESFDVEGAKDAEEEDGGLARDSQERPVLLWHGEQSSVITSRELSPGQTIVVPASYGGIAHGNWNPASAEPVTDVAEFAAERYGRPPVVRLHESVLRGLLKTTEIEVPVPPFLDAESVDDRAVAIDWIERWRSRVAGTRFGDLLDGLWQQKQSLRVERVSMMPGEEGLEYFVVRGKHRRRESINDPTVDGRFTTESAASSFTGVEVTLAEHAKGVAEIVAGFAERIGLSTDLLTDLRLAGDWHDAGKADIRFQRWLLGGSEFKALVQPEPLAKGAARLSGRLAHRLARTRAGYPPGSRHELMSLALMDSARAALAGRAGDWDLVQHLVASHHGYCRPLAPWAPDPTPVEVTFARDGIACNCSSAHGLECLDSGVAERFWSLVRRYGWWGLAWLEAMLRLADHRQSEREKRATRNAYV